MKDVDSAQERINARNTDALLTVLSSPSGGGKTVIIEKILASGDERYVHSVSVTTRPRRTNEVDGRDYWYVSREHFLEMIVNDELVEYESVHDQLYGTPKKPIEKWIIQGRIILFDIDVKGAFSIQKHFPQQTLLIFIQPPDIETLRQRLLKRGTEFQNQIEKRLERAAMEIEFGERFDHIVINDDLNRAVATVKVLINTRITKN